MFVGNYFSKSVRTKFFCLFEWFQVLKSNMNNININHLSAYSEVVSSIANYNCFICTLLNGSKYCYLIQTMQFFKTDEWFQVLQFKTNISIQHYSFVYTIIWFRRLLCNTRFNLFEPQSFFGTQINSETILFDPYMRSK